MGIDAEPFFGPSQRLRWMDVRGVQELTLSRWTEPVRRVELIGEGGVAITIDGEMPDLDELVAQIKEKAPQAPVTTRNARISPPG